MTKSKNHPFPLAFAAACALCGCGEEASLPPLDRRLVVLFTSDEHSHLLAFAPEHDDHPVATTAGSGDLVGGVARRATLIAQERSAAAASGKASILVSAGDNHMGALPQIAFESASLDYGVMKALGYDVTTLGNHEFDFGPAALARSITAAQARGGLPAVVASNVHFSDASPDDDDLAAHYSEDASDDAAIHPYRVVTTAGGLKVGFVGYVGVNASSVEPNKAPVQFSALGLPASLEGDAALVLPQLYADLQPRVDALREIEKVDVVIALAHAGLDTSSPEATAQSEDYLVAQNVSGIDLVISGHRHNPDPQPVEVENTISGKTTLVLNAGAFGEHLGRVELVVHGDGSAVTWEPSSQTLLPVDDRIVPRAEDAALIDPLIAAVEQTHDGDASYLEELLSRVTGAPVHDDPAVAGDLYFHPLARTDFDVDDVDLVLALSADAMLAAADTWGASTGEPTAMALESGGLIGATSLLGGQAGTITAADAFGIVPFGTSPDDGSIGYPLVRAYVYELELRGIFEATLAAGGTDMDYRFSQAGVKVEYDASRPPALSLDDLIDPDKGQVMRILLDGNHADGFEQCETVIYDRAAAVSTPLALYPVVTSSYIAQFASALGVGLKAKDESPLAIEDAILRRPDGSEIKQVEAFLGYLRASPGGKLPPQYDPRSVAATRRLRCTAGCP